MKTAYCFAGGAVVLLLATGPSVAEIPSCDGLPLPATTEELASTPRERFDLEVLAATMDPNLVVDEGFYQRVTGDVDRIHDIAPKIAGISHSPHEYTGKVRLDLDDTAFAAARAGTYDAWDCLNDTLGFEVVEVRDGADEVIVGTDRVLDLLVVSERFRMLPGVLDAQPQPSEIAFIVPPPTICGIREDPMIHYFFEDIFVGTWYLTTVPGEQPKFRGAWDPRTQGQTAPDWYDLRNFCGGGQTVLSDAEIAVDPPNPKVGEEVVLTVSGQDGSSSCGPFFDSFRVDRFSGEIRVLADFNETCGACTADVRPYSFDVPLGTLAESGYQVRYLVRDGCSGSDSLRATKLLSVRPSAAPRPECAVGQRPAATLLVPWFEVDLAKPDGPDTLISVNNATGEPVLANVVLWTDWGIPVLSFPVYLGGDAVQSLSLRRILVDGALPEGAPPADLFPVCNGAMNLPIDAASLAALQAQLTGRPSPEDDLCYGSPRESDLAVGYITADVVRDCSDPVLYPDEDGYFGVDGPAADTNALWGDIYYVDPGQNSAQGIQAVAVLADPAFYMDAAPDTSSFYENGDHRRPLPTRVRARYLRGGAFDGGTSFLVWTGPQIRPAPSLYCDRTSPFYFWHLLVRLQDELGRSEIVEFPRIDLQRATKVEEFPNFPIETYFGQVDFQVNTVCGLCDPPPAPERPQLWVVPVMTANERYSVAYDAPQLEAGCY